MFLIVPNGVTRPETGSLDYEEDRVLTKVRNSLDSIVPIPDPGTSYAYGIASYAAYSSYFVLLFASVVDHPVGAQWVGTRTPSSSRAASFSGMDTIS